MAAEGDGGDSSTEELSTEELSTEELSTALRGVRGVLFDVDHTLVDTAAAFTAALGEAVGPLLGADMDLDAVSAQWAQDRNGWYRRYTGGILDYRTQRHRRVDEVLTDRGHPPLDDGGFDAFDRTFEAAFERAWRPFPDAVQAVRRLAAARVPMGALTNAGADLQRRKLAVVGLGRDVPVLVSMDTFGVGKPDPRVFHEGARALGCDRGATLYVGDEPDVDAEAARRAGLVGVHLRRSGDERFAACPAAAHLEVRDLTALADALALPRAGGTR